MIPKKKKRHAEKKYKMLDSSNSALPSKKMPWIVLSMTSNEDIYK
jgi:hypothetical protein